MTILRCRVLASRVMLALLATLAPGVAFSYEQAVLTSFVTRPGDPAVAMLMVALHPFAGLRYKTFDLDNALQNSGSWGLWRTIPYPVDGAPAPALSPKPPVPLLSWIDGGQWRSNGFYRDVSPTLGLGAPWWTHSGTQATLDLHPTPTDGHGRHFQPASGVVRQVNHNYLHFFGTADDDPSCGTFVDSGGGGLRERWWNADAGQWQNAYHGCPENSTVFLGPQSAATTRPPGQASYQPGQPVHTFVGVTAEPFAGVGSVWVRHAGTGSVGQGWAWLTLGTPAGATQLDRQPLLVTHDRGDGVWRTHVFVAALAADGFWHLFEKYVDTGPGGADWMNFTPDWADHGRPWPLHAGRGRGAPAGRPVAHRALRAERLLGKPGPARIRRPAVAPRLGWQRLALADLGRRAGLRPRCPGSADRDLGRRLGPGSPVLGVVAQ